MSQIVATRDAPSTVPVADLQRESIVLADGTEGRLYWHPDLDTPVPSVTTVKECRVDPEKEEALEGWRNSYDGTDKWSCPHYADQKAYKGHRGTLGHWAILSQLADVPRGAEEADSETALKNWADHRPTLTDPEFAEDDSVIAPLGDPNHHDGEHAWERCMRDIDWAMGEFEDVASEYGITPETVIEAEQYVLDEEIGYSGQFDLLYEAPDGQTVLADLKLSSGIRFGYKLQAAAYANALDRHVDRLQVIRLYPDRQEVEVEDSRDWDRSVTGLCHEFLGLADKAHSERIRPMDQQTLLDAFRDSEA